MNPPYTNGEALIRWMIAVAMVALMVLAVIAQAGFVILLPVAVVLLIDPRKPRGETTAAAMFDYDGYERRAVERSHDRALHGD